MITAEDTDWIPAQTWPEAVESVACMALIAFVLWLVYRLSSGR